MATPEDRAQRWHKIDEAVGLINSSLDAERDGDPEAAEVYKGLADGAMAEIKSEELDKGEE